MYKFFATITAVSILGHAILGCCSHTVHFVACHALPSVSSEHAAHEGSHSHHHPSDNDTSPCQHEPAEDHDCQHAKCQWLASSGNIDLALTSPFHTTGVVSEVFSTQACATLTRNLTTVAEFPPALPLRSHLALGVLLI